MALADAPQFIKDLGRGQTYIVEKEEDGQPVVADGKVVRERVERPALGLWQLVEVITLFNKLTRRDEQAFDRTHGAHEPVAERVAKKIGASAQREGWTVAELKKRCRGAFAHHAGNGEAKRGRDVDLGELVGRWKKRFDAVDVEALEPEVRAAAAVALRAMVEALEVLNEGVTREAKETRSAVRTPRRVVAG